MIESLDSSVAEPEPNHFGGSGRHLAPAPNLMFRIKDFKEIIQNEAVYNFFVLIYSYFYVNTFNVLIFIYLKILSFLHIV
jgi:hypothetical protein